MVGKVQAGTDSITMTIREEGNTQLGQVVRALMVYTNSYTITLMGMEQIMQTRVVGQVQAGTDSFTMTPREEGNFKLGHVVGPDKVYTMTLMGMEECKQRLVAGWEVYTSSHYINSMGMEGTSRQQELELQGIVTRYAMTFTNSNRMPCYEGGLVNFLMEKEESFNWELILGQVVGLWEAYTSSNTCQKPVVITILMGDVNIKK